MTATIDIPRLTASQRHAGPRPASREGVRASRTHSSERRLRPVADVRCGEAPSLRHELATGATGEREQRAMSGRGATLRLTRRGRVVFGALFVVLAFAVFAIGRVSAGASVVAGDHTATVASGDTLWSLATRVAPRVDPRVEVAELEQVNHLAAGQVLTPGQVLLLPVGG